VQAPSAAEPELTASAVEGQASAEALVDVQLTTPAQPGTAARQGVSAPRSRAHQTPQAQLSRLSSGTAPLQAAERGAAGTAEHP